jgi:hypothetical protein
MTFLTIFQLHTLFLSMLLQFFFKKKPKKVFFRFPRINFNQSFLCGLFRATVAMRSQRTLRSFVPQSHKAKHKGAAKTQQRSSTAKAQRCRSKCTAKEDQRRRPETNERQSFRQRETRAKGKPSITPKETKTKTVS